MEDIDAASSVVQRRDGKKTSAVAQTAHVDLPVPKSMWRMMLESQGDDCAKLVEKLVTKSQRLKEDAMSSGTLCSLAERMNSIPGLSVIGNKGHPQAGAATIKKIVSDALEDSNLMMEESEELDKYLNFHARSILRLVEMGAAVDEAFENGLLGVSSNEDSPSLTSVIKPRCLSRDVSYNKYEGPGMGLEVETIDNAMRTLASTNRAKAMSMAHVADPGEMALAFGGGGEGVMAANGTGSLTDDFAPFLNYGGGLGAKRGNLALGGLHGFSGFGRLRDELNLSGLLNVLDGVVDTPGRILIMTTNHPEKLDPALIRPGRIDKKLILGFMHPNDVIQMLEHYFQVKIGEAQKNRICSSVNGDSASNRPSLRLTPAQVEQMTAEHDDIEDMIAALEQKAKPIVVESTTAEVPPKESRITYGGSGDW